MMGETQRERARRVLSGRVPLRRHPQLHEAEALTTAMILAKRAGSTFDRVIITDGGDDTVFCCEHGKGITWPEHRL